MRILVQLKRGLGAEPPAARGYGSLAAKHPAAGRLFLSFREKMLFKCHLDLILRVFRAIWKNKIFEIWEPIEQIPPFTSGQVQNTFKIFHFGVKFCDLAWSGESRYIAFCNIFSIKSFTQRFAFEDFCFVINLTSFRNMYDLETKYTRFNFNNLFNTHFES